MRITGALLVLISVGVAWASTSAWFGHPWWPGFDVTNSVTVGAILGVVGLVLLKTKHPTGRNGSGKSLFFAYLLCILIGPTGAHRFYLGKTFSGLVWLSTFGLGGVGWVFDLVFLPTIFRRSQQRRVYTSNTDIEIYTIPPSGPAPRAVEKEEPGIVAAAWSKLVELGSSRTCDVCRGNGRCQKCGGIGRTNNSYRCYSCNHTGACRTCRGTGIQPSSI